MIKGWPGVCSVFRAKRARFNVVYKLFSAEIAISIQIGSPGISGGFLVDRRTREVSRLASHSRVSLFPRRRRGEWDPRIFANATRFPTRPESAERMSKAGSSEVPLALCFRESRNGFLHAWIRWLDPSLFSTRATASPRVSESFDSRSLQIALLSFILRGA